MELVALPNLLACVRPQLPIGVTWGALPHCLGLTPQRLGLTWSLHHPALLIQDLHPNKIPRCSVHMEVWEAQSQHCTESGV